MLSPSPPNTLASCPLASLCPSPPQTYLGTFERRVEAAVAYAEQRRAAEKAGAEAELEKALDE